MAVTARHQVTVRGPEGAPVMLFAHGFGCDQAMWRHVAPAFEADHRTVTFDLAGFGAAGAEAFDVDRHATLQGHAEDVLAICRELDLRDVVFVGHSVSAMIGVRAAAAEPERFAALVLVCPSPRYLDDPADGYVGGFSAADIDGLLATLDANFLGWSASMAPAIMGNPDRPALGEELTDSFCRADPEVASAFARATFLDDSRHLLGEVRAPTLVLQTRQDIIADVPVGEYVRDHVPDAEMVVLDATGHCPNLSAPEVTVAEIRRFLGRLHD